MDNVFKSDLKAADLEKLRKGTLLETLDIQFTEVGDNFITATMPVDSRTMQPDKILHGGAVMALAESVGSVASASIIDYEKKRCVGIEINANHIRSARSGHVTATARPIHIGGMTHVWDIQVRDDFEQMVSVCRLTVAILER